MSLNSNQKKYIAQNASTSSPEELSLTLDISKKEVLEYLKKRWRPEKYKKYLKRFSDVRVMSSLSFKSFIMENKFILLILAFLVIFSYFNSIHNQFTSDDIPTIVNETNIGNLWNYVFSSPSGFLQRMLYHFAFEIGGTNPIFYRLPNIFFHLGATLAAFLVLYLLVPRNWAIFTSAIFAVHPILSESVSWISGGLYAQMGFFFLVSFALYILSSQKKFLYYFSIAFYILAMTASEKAVVLFFALIAYEIAFGNIKENWKKLWPYITISLFFGTLFFSRMGSRISSLQTQYYLDPGTDSLFIKIPTSIYSYIRLIFWPDNLSIYQTEMFFTKLQYFGTIMVFLVYTAAIIYFFIKDKKIISFWLSFFIISLLPSLSPLRIAWAVAERYAYLGALGIFVVIGWFFYLLSENKKTRTATFLLFWVVIAAFSTRTIMRNRDWKSEETLWTATEKTSPSGPNIHNNMGAIYQSKGENEKAIEEFKLAVKINPRYADVYHNLGNTYYQMQKYPEAVEYYQKAVEINPQLWQSHQNLAVIYFNQGQYSQAQDEMKNALKINPTNTELQNNMKMIDDKIQGLSSQK